MANIIRRNPVVTSIIVAAISFAVSWAIWVTTSIYAVDRKVEVSLSRLSSMSDSYCEIRDDIKGVRASISSLDAKVDAQYRELVRLFTKSNGSGHPSR